MFRVKTAIIVGAGCSAEYLLPVGLTLRDNIADLLATTEAYYQGRNGFDRDFMNAFSRMAESDLDAYLLTAIHMSQGLRHSGSIDRYLHIHRADERVINIGKLAIAYLIMRAERASTLQTRLSGQIDMNRAARRDLTDSRAQPKPHYLYELFERMHAGAERLDLKTAFENVVFVCFNYDRCIEHYFHHAVRSVGHYSDAQASEALQALRIYHPYGQIGLLPWQTGADKTNSLAFDDDDPPINRLPRLSKGIRTFTEKLEDTQELQEMREAVRTADQLVFLGFSFLDQNMDLLTSDESCAATRVYATTFQESESNVSIFENHIWHLLKGRAPGPPPSTGATFVSATAGQFLKDYGNALAR